MENTRKNVSENSHFPSEVKTVQAETLSGHLHLQYHMVEKGAMVSSPCLHNEPGPIYESDGSSRRVTCEYAAALATICLRFFVSPLTTSSKLDSTFELRERSRKYLDCIYVLDFEALREQLLNKENLKKTHQE